MKKRIYDFLMRHSREPGRLRTEQYIIIAFAAVILFGAILLTMPVASRDGHSSGFLTALFTATSATCVTGLTLVDTYLQWSAFGQIVIISLIQIGGLGFMTIASVFFFLLHRKIGLQQRLIIAQGFSLNDVDGVVHLVQNVLKGTFLFEFTGAAILTARFSRDVGFWRALRWGVFHSVSAFCNAGFDILGYLKPGSSLACYANDFVVNMTIMLLIVIGGLGFYVWSDLMRRGGRRHLSLYTKLVLTITAILIVGGASLFAIFEWNNPATFGQFSSGGKALASFFQSVTCRTAGFATVDEGKLTEASKAISVLLMLIGGSSGSTAGGIKTVTFGVLILAAVSAMRGRSRVTAYGRTIANDQIRQAMTIMILMIGLAFGGAVFLSATNGFPFIASLFETASALGTVGLTTGITPTLNTASRILLIMFMYFGRVGIMTFSLSFLFGDRPEERYHYAEGKVLIG